MIQIEIINFQNLTLSLTYVIDKCSFWFVGLNAAKELKYYDCVNALMYNVPSQFKKLASELKKTDNKDFAIFNDDMIFISERGLYALIRDSTIMATDKEPRNILKCDLIELIEMIFNNKKIDLLSIQNMDINYEHNEECKEIIMEIIEMNKNIKYAYESDVADLLKVSTKTPNDPDKIQYLFIIYEMGKRQNRVSFVTGKRCYFENAKRKYKYSKGTIIYDGCVANVDYSVINLIEAIENELDEDEIQQKTIRSITFRRPLSVDRIKTLFRESSTIPDLKLKKLSKIVF